MSSIHAVMAGFSGIRIVEHPFESPEAYALVRGLESDLAAFYPDWDQLSSPNHQPDPRPASPLGAGEVLGSDKVFNDSRQTNDASDPSKTGLFFFIAFDGSTPVGCAALRLLTISPAVPSFEPPSLPEGLAPYLTYCEIKRMYVVPSHRQRGLSKLMISHLEEFATQRLNMDRLVLEVGLRQKAAVRLYHFAGFAPRPMYGEYIGMEVQAGGDSICMEKVLYPL